MVTDLNKGLGEKCQWCLQGCAALSDRTDMEKSLFIDKIIFTVKSLGADKLAACIAYVVSWIPTNAVYHCLGY